VELDISDEALAAKNEKVGGRGVQGWIAAAAAVAERADSQLLLVPRSEPSGAQHSPFLFTTGVSVARPPLTCALLLAPQCGGRLARSFRGPAFEVFAKVSEGFVWRAGAGCLGRLAYSEPWLACLGLKHVERSDAAAKVSCSSRAATALPPCSYLQPPTAAPPSPHAPRCCAGCRAPS